MPFLRTQTCPEPEKILRHAVIVFPVRNERVLLAWKTQKIGANRWNGFGGGIEAGETARTTAIRETREECGLRLVRTKIQKIALIDFHNITSAGEKFTCRCHVFRASRWAGIIRPTPEMIRPTWFSINQLPLDDMMYADRHWIPVALTGRTIWAEFFYGPRQEFLRRQFDPEKHMRSLNFL
ncbi:MAG TPA: NUDIX domain-containing protein [Candidatus Paceibacterota bacterium]|nr:NUDIX domain-containing protein [Candidatus Paceibacterota bacterium]